MRKRSLLFVLVLVVALGLVSIASAELPGSGYYIGAVTQNVGDAPATVNVTAYGSAAGGQTYTLNVPDPLPPGGTFTLLSTGIPGGPNFTPELPSGFEGSAIVNSDQPVVTQVNVTNRLSGELGDPAGKAAAIYQGVEGTEAATEVFFPLAKHNHFNKTTTFFLQNAGSSPTTIAVVFTVNGTDYPYNTASIAAGQMVAVEPGLAGVPSGNGNVGAMSATASQPLAAVMLEHEHDALVGTVLQGSGSFAPDDLEQTAYCPLFKTNFFNRDTGLQVMNTHTAAQNVTVTLQPGGEVINITNLAPGASETVINPAGVADGLYSATVVGSAGTVAVIANESELPIVGARQTSTTYKCLAASSATNKLSYPAYKELWFGRQVGFQVQNVGGANASVVLEFTDQNDNVYTTLPQSIAPGASTVFVCVSSQPSLWDGPALPAPALAGVVAHSMNDEPIIAVANEASWTSVAPCLADNTAAGFDKANGLGFNLSTTP